MKLIDLTWIHIAGKPSNIVNQTPPYWRYRIPGREDEQLFDRLVVTGFFRANNNAQGAEIGADFLLWYALLGVPSIIEQDDERILHIQLPSPSLKETAMPHIHGDSIVHNARVKIFGAPDNVKSGSKLWWRALINDDPIEIETFCLYGQSGSINNSTQEDAQSSNPLQRLWLQFHGDVYRTGKHIDIKLTPGLT